jgi:hypothetical protein
MAFYLRSLNSCYIGTTEGELIKATKVNVGGRQMDIITQTHFFFKCINDTVNC